MTDVRHADADADADAAVMSDVRAVDVALLPTPDLRRRLIAINSTLAPPPAGFHFDSTHLAHLTLAQQFIRHDDIERLSRAIGRTLQGHRPLTVTTTEVSVGGTASTLGVERTAAVMDLHRHLMDLLIPFGTDEGGVEAFEADGDTPRDADVAWVRDFRERAAYERFSPHWTLGVGGVPTPGDAQTSVASDVALLSLGRFCACRRVLASWTLTVSDR